MPQARRIFMLLGIAGGTLAAPVRAEPLPLDRRVTPACAAMAHELEPRLERALDGRVVTGLRGSVTIENGTSGFRVTIAIREGEQARGTTAIVAPTCEEAVDAAVVVLALAFGGRSLEASTPPPEAAGSENRSAAPTVERARAPRSFAPVADRFTSVRPTLELFHSAPLDRVDAGAGGDRRLPASDRATRVALATGVDSGSLSQETMTLSAAVSRSFSGVDLRAVLRYGTPTADERVETELTSAQRSDFAALELRGCRGSGLTVHLSACAGGELGVVRVASRLRAEGTDIDENALLPRLSAVVAAVVSRRGGLIEPELELAGSAVALGRDEEVSRFVVRVAAGAAVAF